MSEASELIERMERETGQRIDENDGDNLALAGLFGAIARITGKSSHDARDDVPAGVVAKHQISPAGQREKKSDGILAMMLLSGLSPDEIRHLTGND